MQFVIYIVVVYSLLLLANSTCFARDITIKWAANTEHDLAGYKIYYKVGSATEPFDGVGAAEGPSPIDVHNVTTATLSGLDPALNYYLAATAYNDSGAEGLLSDVVFVYDLEPPTVSIAYPANNETVFGNINIGVNASDASGMAKVEFYLDSVLKGTSVTAPYIFTWNTSAIPEKTYSIYTIAYDIAGNKTQSSTIQVNVIHYNILNDALLAFRYALGLETLSSSQFNRLDVAPINMTTHQPNPDGRVDIDDVLVMLHKAVGLPW